MIIPNYLVILSHRCSTSFFRNLSSLFKITRATSLKIGASYAKNWAGDLLVRIYPQLGDLSEISRGEGGGGNFKFGFGN